MARRFYKGHWSADAEAISPEEARRREAARLLAEEVEEDEEVES